MSIATEITNLTNDRAAIRTALVNKGVTAASEHGFSSFAADIAAIVAGGGISNTDGVIVVLTKANATVAASPSLNFSVHELSGNPTAHIAAVPPNAFGTYTITTSSSTAADKTATVNVEGSTLYTVNHAARLPDAYQEVEYLQSDGTALINTGGQFKKTYTAELDFKMMETPTDSRSDLGIFGSSVSAYDVAMLKAGYNIWNSINPFFEVRLTTDQGTKFNHAFNTDRHTVKIERSSSSEMKVYFDSEDVATAADLHNDKQYGLFCTLNGSTPNSDVSKTRIYEFKMYEGDTLLTQLIPCYKVSNNEAGFYDLISNSFYSNAASGGTFIVGSNV